MPLLSLPLLFGTDLNSIPADVPYLHPDPALVERWQIRLAALPGFKVGIAWQGSGKNRTDHLRSIPLEAFAPLARVEGVRLVSLQKGAGSEQVRAVDGRFAVAELPGLDESGGAFVDTAAVLASLDLVVCCDTALGHLAGALGVPCWLALMAVPDWRWLLGRDDSPWYPRCRLFRQDRPGDLGRRLPAPRRRPAPAAGRGAVTSQRSVSRNVGGLENFFRLCQRFRLHWVEGPAKLASGCSWPGRTWMGRGWAGMRVSAPTTPIYPLQ
jgi:hypothetical protein